MTKPSKWYVRPAKTQISLDIRPAWSEPPLCAICVAKDPKFHHAESEDWTDWVDAKADLSIRWAHTSFWRLCQAKGHVYFSVSSISRYICLGWGLTSQSTIFQSCRDGATTSWVINQYFRGVKCLAQGHNTAAVGFEPRTSRSGVRHSTTEPPRSPISRYSFVI